MAYTAPLGTKLKHGVAAQPADLQAAGSATAAPTSTDAEEAQFNTGGFSHIRLLLDKSAAVNVDLVVWVWDATSAKWYQAGLTVTDTATVADDAVNVLNVGRGVSCYVQLAVIASGTVSVGIVGLDLGVENV